MTRHVPRGAEEPEINVIYGVAEPVQPPRMGKQAVLIIQQNKMG